MAFCSNCGNKLSESDKFCEACGNPQNDSISESVSTSIIYTKAITSILLFKGRITRAEYVKSVIFIAILSTPGIWAANVYYSYDQSMRQIVDLLRMHYAVWIGPILFYVFLNQSIKRCRDIGRSLWFLLVPIVSILYLLLEESKLESIIEKKTTSSPIKPKDGAGLR